MCNVLYHATPCYAKPYQTTKPYYKLTYLYHTIPYHTIPYHTIPYHTIPYHTIPYHTVPYCTILYHAIPCHTMPYHSIPYHTKQYYTTLCKTTLYYTKPYTILNHIPYHILPYHILPYRTMPCRAIPYHTIAHDTIQDVLYNVQYKPCHTTPYYCIRYHTIPHHIALYHTSYRTIPYYTTFFSYLDSILLHFLVKLALILSSSIFRYCKLLYPELLILLATLVNLVMFLYRFEPKFAFWREIHFNNQQCTFISCIESTKHFGMLFTQVCCHIVHCYAVASQFEKCREKIAEMQIIVQELCRLLYYKVSSRNAVLLFV